jgi:hypothetical protein
MTEKSAPVFCARCGKECKSTALYPNGTPMFTGYGIMQDGSKHCYDCCALVDLENMNRDGKTTLYLVQEDGKKWYITNWPGSLRFGPLTVKKGGHNFGGVRYDTWFGYAGRIWHGYTIGDFTQVCHVKRTKETTSRNQLVKPA